MKMKKIIAIALVSVMAGTIFTGCAKKDSDTMAGTSDKLVVAMEIGYPPMEYIDKDGATKIGFDVEVAKAISEKLNRKLVIKDVAWDGIFTSLDTNRADCIISAVSITDDRKSKYNLTDAYIANKLCLVTRKDSKITDPDSLAGKKVAVQTETTADTYMKKKIADGLAIKTDDYKVYDKVINCFDDLKAQRVDAVLVDSVVAAYYIGTDSATYSVTWENTTAEPMAIALKKGNDKLTADIQKAVNDLYADGTMTTIAKKYFGDKNTVTVK